MVLVFRNQNLSRDEHKTFARNFGELHIHPSKRNGMNKDDPEIFVIDIKADARQANGEAWHSDVSCEPVRPLASLLYVTKTPENEGGDTMFANMYEAYNELSEAMKHLLSDKQAFHDGEIDLRNYGVKLKPGQFYPSAHHRRYCQASGNKQALPFYQWEFHFPY
jgi:taurine dioxygenase